MTVFHSLLCAGLLLATPAASFAQGSPARKHKVSKKAFEHRAETDKNRNSKAQFRRDNKPAFIDLRPNDPGKTKSVRAPKPYKYSKG